MLAKILEMLGELISKGGANFFVWLWSWIELLSYWVASIGGCGSMCLYIGTKDDKYRNFTVILLIVYVIVQAAGTVI